MVKVVTQHVWYEYAEDVRYTEEWKERYIQYKKKVYNVYLKTAKKNIIKIY